ncbi:riboflavin biosynthesis protein RibF [Levilactobacillus brevis]|uniref:riboflavin biosynthesis protein RibF n=1 Tax=Levilactobacillus brevis TaxID=1580 RepID=UPI0005B63CCC|nr:riboflavin biosynthesis protein RibF [Levilactobacillus brevis]KIR08162.1 riboflavin biosynthesis protein RibF [Levilactobacillus brevis]
MDVIRIHHPLDARQIPDEPVVLAMGFFDGVHRGHQAVIARAKALAQEKQAKLAVLTYDHHPALVYRPLEADDRKYLSIPTRKLQQLERLGVERVFLVNYTGEFASQSPQEFVDHYLVVFHTVVAVAGFDHTYGKKDVATMDRLADYAKGRFTVETVAQEAQDQQKISSTRIRQAMKQGDIDLANQLLGYPYRSTGVVVHGEARGRTIGYPTANILTPENQWLPGIGIYTARLKVGAIWYPGMVSIGRNVTFGDGRPITVEMNLLDFQGNLYGEPVEVEWQHRLRGEIKFADADGLVDQLQQDERETRAYFQRLTQ